MAARIFTAQEEQQIRLEYEAGASTLELAAKHYCHRGTIYNAIHRAGGKLSRTRTREMRINLPMFIHDWNADKSCESMARTYGYKNADVVRRTAQNYKDEGYPLKNRRSKHDYNPDHR